MFKVFDSRDNEIVCDSINCSIGEYRGQLLDDLGAFASWLDRRGESDRVSLLTSRCSINENRFLGALEFLEMVGTLDDYDVELIEDQSIGLFDKQFSRIMEAWEHE